MSMTLEELKEKWEVALEANNSEDFVKATDICREIVKSHPKFAQAWYMLAALSVKFNQRVLAKDYLVKLVPLVNDNNDLKLETARLLYLVKEFHVSKAMYISLPDAENSPTILSELGQCLWHLGEFSLAINLLQKSYDASEFNPKFAIPLIRAYLSFGDKELAQKTCASALEKFQDNKDLYLYYLLILWDKGLHSQVLDKLPHDPETNSNEANFFFGFVCLVNDLDIKAEEYFHPTLQDETFRAKVKGLKEVHKKSANKEDFYVVFNTDILSVAKATCIEGDVYEFGTYRGRSTAILSNVFPEKSIYSFDSFLGLPEQWTKNEGPGEYSTNGELPLIELKNAKYIKGWYKDSLPQFFKAKRKPASFVHIDCDLYSSTKTALENVYPLLQKGTLIAFDDFLGYPGFEEHEYKAFYEFAEKYSIKYEMINYALTGREVLFRILEV